MNFWENLHPLLRREKNDENGSANGAILNAFANSLSNAEKKLINDRLRESFKTADKEYLDYWGNWFGVLRKAKEDDDSYRERIKKYLLLHRGTIQSIIDGVRYYLDDQDAIVNVYEPWKNIFTLDKSELDGRDALIGKYYHSGVIDVSLGQPITPGIIRAIYAFKPAGVHIWTNYNPLTNHGLKPEYLGQSKADMRTHLYLQFGSQYDQPKITLGLDDYDYKQVYQSSLKAFRLDRSSLDSDDVLTNPFANNLDNDNLLLGTSFNESVHKDAYDQKAKALAGTKYTFKGLIKPDVRARVALQFITDTGVSIYKVSSPEIRAQGSMKDGFTPVNLSATAPKRTDRVEILVDNRTSVTDNEVYKSKTSFTTLNGNKGKYPATFDLVKDIGGRDICAQFKVTIKNLKSGGTIALVDEDDTGNSDPIVPLKDIAADPTKASRFMLDSSELDSKDELSKSTTPVNAPIEEDGEYFFTAATTKHSLTKDAKGNRISVKTNIDADFDIEIKIAVVDTQDKPDMTWSPAVDEDGYYNNYKTKQFKLVSGDSPNLAWTPASDEVYKPSPYYVDIVRNTNITLNERELRNTKAYNETGAKLHYAKLHNRNIALQTGIPIYQKEFTKISPLYNLSMDIEKGKTYTVLLNYASEDEDKDKKISITDFYGNSITGWLPLYTNGDVKTYKGTWTSDRDVDVKHLELHMANDLVGNDLYIVNFKLGISD